MFFWFVKTISNLSKPNPKMFQYMCDLAGIKADETCYIGDNLEKDAIGASVAGLRGLWLNRNGRTVPDEIESITSLKKYKPNKTRQQRRRGIASFESTPVAWRVCALAFCAYPTRS